MAHATLLPPPPPSTEGRPSASRKPAVREGLPPAAFRFESLVLTEAHSLARARSVTLTTSIVMHSLLVVALIIVPLFFEEILPAPDGAVRAFFVTPAVAAPPPPPPPPPAPGVRAAPRTPVAPHPEEPAKFVAPIETPAEVKPEEGISLGVEGGVPGGVEGGVPGGVVGGIVGGLPQQAPPPPKAVRVGGSLKAPQLLRRVDPEFPELAKQARLSALIILEATVSADGHVQDVTILRGQPLFDEPAMSAVRQWVYRPLLLNGIPTPFVLSVTVKFTFRAGVPPIGGAR
jgi:protein TonB